MAPTPMRRLLPCAPLGLLWLLLAAPAQAQTPATATVSRPDPTDPQAQVPLVRYTPAFAQFRRLGDDKPVGWREANDTVARIGGWRVYTREAQQADPSPAATQAPAAPVAPAAPAAPLARPAPAGAAGHKH